MRRNERERVARRKAYKQEQALKIALKLGELNGCFKNSTKAVFACPDRLKYVEGFVVGTCSCCGGYTYLTHHAWVVDKVTGKRHELTIRNPDPDDKYIGKEFERDELTDPFDCPIEHFELWCPQLMLQEQLDMLQAAGYDVELQTDHWNEAAREVDDCGDVVDMSTIDLTDRFADYALEDKRGEGWRYSWRLKEAQTMVAEAVTA
jgi:hypothetical protein